MNNQPVIRSQKLRILVECAIMIALATVLSFIKLWEMPQGGSVTAVSMLPLVLLGLRRGPKWSFGACLVYGVLQFVLDPKNAFSLPVILLDYVLAFGALGIAGFFRGKSWGVWAAIPAAFLGRLVFHFVSGIVLWGAYAPEGTPAWLYSLGYNGSFMAVETIATLAVAGVLRLSLPRLLKVDNN